jgi:DNA-binding protein YbaB
MIQDLVISAVNEALRQADKMVNTEMQKIAGMPGLPKDLF